MSIEMIEIMSYSGPSPKVMARVYFSSELGLTCDHPLFAEDEVFEGVVLPPGDKVLYPKDGRPYFDALKFKYDGSYLGALPAVVVDEQKGTPFPEKLRQDYRSPSDWRPMKGSQ